MNRAFGYHPETEDRPSLDSYLCYQAEVGGLLDGTVEPDYVGMSDDGHHLDLRGWLEGFGARRRSGAPLRNTVHPARVRCSYLLGEVLDELHALVMSAGHEDLLDSNPERRISSVKSDGEVGENRLDKAMAPTYFDRDV